MKKKKRIFSFSDVVVVVVFTSIIMCFLGGILIYKHLGGINYSLLGEDANLQEFISAYNNLTEKYYDTLDKSSLIDGAIDGMYSKVGDPYTTYLDSEGTDTLNSSLSGEYEGIGVKVGTSDSDNVIITTVYEDTPAQRSGILVGDIITRVNDEDVSTKTSTEIADAIKKSPNKRVTLSVLRGEEELSFTMNIEKLYVPLVSYEILKHDDSNVGYISLSVFNDTADTQFANALNKLENAGIDSLIIDVRSNTGGYLQVAKNIAEMFLEKGKTIYSLESKDSKDNYLDETNEKRSYELAVLINGSSASASEILASALKYSYGAILVGEKSYGKGKVQEKATLSDGTTVKYTTAKWLTPNGNCIDGIGLTPDVSASLDIDTYNSLDISTDSQVKSALHSLVD